MSSSPDKQTVPGPEATGRNPGDSASPGEPQTAENICRTCSGTGRVDGKSCPDCSGTGKVVEIVGDA
jgi:DnaJ-class molecular chaperone